MQNNNNINNSILSSILGVICLSFCSLYYNLSAQNALLLQKLALLERGHFEQMDTLNKITSVNLKTLISLNDKLTATTTHHLNYQLITFALTLTVVAIAGFYTHKWIETSTRRIISEIRRGSSPDSGGTSNPGFGTDAAGQIPPSADSLNITPPANISNVMSPENVSNIPIPEIVPNISPSVLSDTTGVIETVTSEASAAVIQVASILSNLPSPPV